MVKPPIEWHIPGMRYCGPGTRLDKKLDANNQPIEGQQPIDRVDEAALRHDLAYGRHGDIRNRHRADMEMIHEVIDIKEPTRRERCEQCIVLPLMLLKRFFDGVLIRIMNRLGINGSAAAAAAAETADSV